MFRKALLVKQWGMSGALPLIWRFPHWPELLGLTQSRSGKLSNIEPGSQGHMEEKTAHLALTMFRGQATNQDTLEPYDGVMGQRIMTLWGDVHFCTN